MKMAPIQAPRLLIQALLRAYKRFISPTLPASCRFTPSCSEYAMEAVERHGAFVGTLLSAWRVLRCNPFSKGGLDTVPKHFFRTRALLQLKTRNEKLETSA